MLCVALAGTLGWATAAKKKKQSPVQRVTAAQQAAAREEIAHRMAAAGPAFENPEALEPFYKSLASGPVHILQFGDSHTASDDWVNAMRTLLQLKFGNGGPGFVQAGRPFKGYRRFDAKASASLGWRTEGTMALRGDPDQGLSGIKHLRRNSESNHWTHRVRRSAQHLLSHAARWRQTRTHGGWPVHGYFHHGWALPGPAFPPTRCWPVRTISP